MTELKIWVDRIQRVVSGVTPATTTHEILAALTSVRGTPPSKTPMADMLVLRQRGGLEHVLQPTDRPLRLVASGGGQLVCKPQQFWSDSSHNKLDDGGVWKGPQGSGVQQPPPQQQRPACQLVRGTVFRRSARTICDDDDTNFNLINNNNNNNHVNNNNNNGHVSNGDVYQQQQHVSQLEQQHLYSSTGRNGNLVRNGGSKDQIAMPTTKMAPPVPNGRFLPDEEDRLSKRPPPYELAVRHSSRRRNSNARRNHQQQQHENTNGGGAAIATSPVMGGTHQNHNSSSSGAGGNVHHLVSSNTHAVAPLMRMNVEDTRLELQQVVGGQKQKLASLASSIAAIDREIAQWENSVGMQKGEEKAVPSGGEGSIPVAEAELEREVKREQELVQELSMLRSKLSRRARDIETAKEAARLRLKEIAETVFDQALSAARKERDAKEEEHQQLAAALRKENLQSLTLIHREELLRTAGNSSSNGGSDGTTLQPAGFSTGTLRGSSARRRLGAAGPPQHHPMGVWV